MEEVQTMENEPMVKPEVPPAYTRKTYCKPQLVEYGQVQELTQSGGSTRFPGENSLYGPLS